MKDSSEILETTCRVQGAHSSATRESSIVQSVIWLVAASGLFQTSRPDTGTVTGPRLSGDFASYHPSVASVDTTPRRARAVEYSDLYGVRLSVHRYASFATVPLFAAEYAIGRSLYAHPGSSPSLRSAHGAVAGAVAGLFAVNTVTGVWNLWDSRRDPAGRTRRYIHSALMLAADAGFVWTGALAPDDEDEGRGVPVADTGRRSRHRTVAISSMATALAGYLMMLVWKD
jgi:hypothetical protein